MSTISTLNAQLRERVGKGGARLARKHGLVPAVVYGGNQPPHAIAIESGPFRKELTTRGLFSRQIDLDIAGKKHRVLARDVQFHPVNDTPLHVDFLRVTEKTRVTVQVAVVFLNESESPGLKRGGVLNVVRHEIEVNTSVANIPDHFEVDLAGLDIGASIHISAVKLPEDVILTITDRDFTIATIAAPSVMVEDEPTEEEEESQDSENEGESEET